MVILNWMTTEPAVTLVMTMRLASTPRSAAKALMTACCAVVSKSATLPETVIATSTVPSAAVAEVPDWMACCVPVALVTLVTADTRLWSEFEACWLVTGLPVGERLGKDVLGDCVGDFEGALVMGEPVGDFVGTFVGEPVSPEGAGVGATVGGEGESVGEFVGPDVVGV